MLVLSYIHWCKTYIAIVALAVLKIFQVSLDKNKLHISTLILSRLKTFFWLLRFWIYWVLTVQLVVARLNLMAIFASEENFPLANGFLYVWDEMKGICDKRCLEIIRLGIAKISMVQVFQGYHQFWWQKIDD